jgi:hypothetical protein
MKKFIIGLIVGMLAMSFIPVGAISEYILYKSECSLSLNGKTLEDETLPILNYNGYNYLPAALFRKVMTDINGKFEWNDKDKEIELTTATIVKSVDTREVKPVEEILTEKEIPPIPEGQFYIISDDIGNFIVMDSDLKKYKCTHVSPGKNAFDSETLVSGYWEDDKLYLMQRTRFYSDFTVEEL